MQNSIGKYWHSESLRLFFCNGFAFLLPFHQKVSTVFLLFWAVYSLTAFERRVCAQDKRIVVPALLYALFAVSILYSENSDFSFLERKSALIALPLVFYLNGEIIAKNLRTTLHFFLFGCVFSLLYCEFNALYNTWQYWWRPKNFFIEKRFSELHQTVYFALYLLMGLLILYYFPLRKRWLNVSVFLFLFTGLLQISNRAALLIFFLLVLLHLFASVRGVYRVTATALAAIALFAVVFAALPRWRHTIQEFRQYGLSARPGQDASTTYNLRIASWDASWTLIRQHWLFGAGAGDAQTALNKTYEENGYSEALERQLNPHNTYFSLWLETGIAGLFWLFLYFFNIGKQIHAQQNLRLFYAGFLLILGVNFLFESMFSRYSGLVFIVFFYCLFITHRPRTPCNA